MVTKHALSILFVFGFNNLKTSESASYCRGNRGCLGSESQLEFGETLHLFVLQPSDSGRSLSPWHPKLQSLMSSSTWTASCSVTFLILAVCVLFFFFIYIFLYFLFLSSVWLRRKQRKVKKIKFGSL